MIIRVIKGNKDVLSSVFGMSVDASSLIKVLDAMKNDMKLLSEHDKKLYRLYLIINSIDVELMKDSLRIIDKFE